MKYSAEATNKACSCTETKDTWEVKFDNEATIHVFCASCLKRTIGQRKKKAAARSNGKATNAV